MKFSSPLCSTSCKSAQQRLQPPDIIFKPSEHPSQKTDNDVPAIIHAHKSVLLSNTQTKNKWLDCLIDSQFQGDFIGLIIDDECDWRSIIHATKDTIAIDAEDWDAFWLMISLYYNAELELASDQFRSLARFAHKIGCSALEEAVGSQTTVTLIPDLLDQEPYLPQLVETVHDVLAVGHFTVNGHKINSLQDFVNYIPRPDNNEEHMVRFVDKWCASYPNQPGLSKAVANLRLETLSREFIEQLREQPIWKFLNKETVLEVLMYIAFLEEKPTITLPNYSTTHEEVEANVDGKTFTEFKVSKFDIPLRLCVKKSGDGVDVSLAIGPSWRFRVPSKLEFKVNGKSKSKCSRCWKSPYARAFTWPKAARYDVSISVKFFPHAAVTFKAELHKK